MDFSNSCMGFTAVMDIFVIIAMIRAVETQEILRQGQLSLPDPTCIIVLFAVIGVVFLMTFVNIIVIS